MADVDSELLGRIAASLEENSRAMRTIEGEVHQLGRDVAEVKTSLRSAHARIRGIEDKLDGSGSGDGLKTELRVTQRDLQDVIEDVSDLEKWRKEHANKSLQKAENKIEKTDDRHWAIYIAIIAAAISIVTSGITCGPQMYAKAKGEASAGH